MFSLDEEQNQTFSLKTSGKQFCQSLLLQPEHNFHNISAQVFYCTYQDLLMETSWNKYFKKNFFYEYITIFSYRQTSENFVSQLK